MAATPKRGAVAPPKNGVYREPDTDGVRNTAESNPYRRPPDGIKDARDINYIPYGGVYERADVHPIDRTPSGGAYENPAVDTPEVVDIFVASLTYPPILIDSMNILGSIVSGTMNQIPEDSVQVSSTVLSSTISPALKTYYWPEESTQVNSTILDGTIVQILKTYYWPEEFVQVNSTILSSTLENKLVTYSNWPDEYMEVGSLIIGGTLA